MRQFFTRVIRDSPRYSIALFYFVLGFVFIFPSVNIWLFLKEKTKLDPGRLAMEMQIVDIPWLFKPVYAWVSDRFPIAGYRRKSYVGMFSLYCAVCWFVMPPATEYLVLFYVLWTLENLFLCIADVVVDALVIERVKREEEGETQGSLQSICSTCRSLGKCVGSLLGALLFVEGASSKEMFYITGLAPLCVAIGSFWINEKPVVSEQVKSILATSDEEFKKELLTGKSDRNWWYYMKNMFTGFVRTDMWKFCLVATSYIIAPDPEAGYFYYYQDIMKVPDFELQIVLFAHEAGLLFGSFLFVMGLRKASPRRLMTFSTILVSGLIMSHAVLVFLAPFSLVTKMWLIYAYEFVKAVADIFLFMPLAVMGAQLVTDGVEGTSYALVLSIQNLGGFIDSFVASQMMNALGISGGKMDHLWYMSFICAFFFLTPLTFLSILPNKVALDTKKSSVLDKEQ